MLKNNYLFYSDYLKKRNLKDKSIVYIHLTYIKKCLEKNAII